MQTLPLPVGASGAFRSSLPCCPASSLSMFRPASQLGAVPPLAAIEHLRRVSSKGHLVDPSHGYVPYGGDKSGDVCLSAPPCAPPPTCRGSGPVFRCHNSGTFMGFLLDSLIRTEAGHASCSPTAR